MTGYLASEVSRKLSGITLKGQKVNKELDLVNLEDGTTMLYRNVGDQIPKEAVSQPRRTSTS